MAEPNPRPAWAISWYRKKTNALTICEARTFRDRMSSTYWCKCHQGSGVVAEYSSVDWHAYSGASAVDPILYAPSHTSCSVHCAESADLVGPALSGDVE